MRTLITTIFVIVKVRRGSDEDHRGWEAREKLRLRLHKAAKKVLGGKYGSVISLDNDSSKCAKEQRNFFYTLLCDDAVIDALRKVEKDSSFGSVSCCCCFGQNEAKEELAARINALWEQRETFLESS